VAYLRVGAYRADYSDLTPAFQEAFRSWGARKGTWACEVIEPLRPEPGDIDLIKTGSGGFNSSALDIHLRNAGIRNVLYTGVITNGCVLLTAAQGFDLGYKGYLVTDATATTSQRIQDAAEETMALYVAKPVSTDEVLAMLARGAA
jgi:nicotinamidase-related amidase